VRSPWVAAVSEKVALVPPEGIVTAAGNVPLPAPFANIETASPLAGAGSLEKMVTVVLLPSTSVVVGVVSTSVTGCLTVNRLLPETVFWLPSTALVKVKLIEIVVVPARDGKAKPLKVPMNAIEVSELTQGRALVRSLVVPSVSTPVARNRSGLSVV